jgi:hypothetical protein
MDLFFALARSDCDRCAFLQQRFGNASADTARRAGDERLLACESEVHNVSP